MNKRFYSIFYGRYKIDRIRHKKDLITFYMINSIIKKQILDCVNYSIKIDDISLNILNNAFVKMRT